MSANRNSEKFRYRFSGVYQPSRTCQDRPRVHIQALPCERKPNIPVTETRRAASLENWREKYQRQSQGRSRANPGSEYPYEYIQTLWHKPKQPNYQTGVNYANFGPQSCCNVQHGSHLPPEYYRVNMGPLSLY